MIRFFPTIGRLIDAEGPKSERCYITESGRSSLDVKSNAQRSTTGRTKRLRSGATFAAIVALSVGLGGCLTSRQPLFAEATAVAALGEGGRYGAYERIGGRYNRDETVELRRHNRGYDYINEKGSVTPVTLHPLGKDLFAVQAMTENGEYVYARVRIRGDTGFVQVPGCDKQDMNKLAALGVAARENALAKLLVGRDHVQVHDCVLDGVRDVTKLFSTIDFGAPTGKLVRE
jgi:hypothetical protein